MARHTTHSTSQLLTLVDVYSKYTFAIPIPNERAHTVGLALLHEVSQHFGYPKLLLSDRAHGFASRGLTWLCRYLGIAKISTMALRSNANPVERTHSLLNKIMSVLCNTHRDD